MSGPYTAWERKKCRRRLRFPKAFGRIYRRRNVQDRRTARHVREGKRRPHDLLALSVSLTSASLFKPLLAPFASNHTHRHERQVSVFFRRFRRRKICSRYKIGQQKLDKFAGEEIRSGLPPDASLKNITLRWAVGSKTVDNTKSMYLLRLVIGRALRTVCLEPGFQKATVSFSESGSKNVTQTRGQLIHKQEFRQLM